MLLTANIAVVMITFAGICSMKRNRLADTAFEAQDEAATLRQQLQELQERQGLLHTDRAAGGDDDDNGKLKRTQLLDGEGEGGGSSDVKTMEDVNGAEGESVGAEAGRVVQLEIERWETEQGKQEAEEQAKRAAEEARQAKVALDEAQAKVGLLTIYLNFHPCFYLSAQVW